MTLNMGGTSTSQSAVLHGKRTRESSAFDLRSWQGLTQVLKMGKDSLTEPGAYSEFRNLVLEYAQKGGDPEIRKKIDAIIATFNTIEEKEEKKEISAKKSSTDTQKEEYLENKSVSESTPHAFGNIGTRRPTPRFTVPSVSVEAKVEPLAAPVVEASEPVVPTVEVSLKEESVLPKEPEESTSVVLKQEPAPVPPSAPAYEFKTVEEYKARIAEIKRLVNARVGNPATLIDTHNEIGKKYMTALLSALKATGGGGENIDSAMIALEESFELLMNSDAEKDALPVNEVSEPQKEEIRQPEETPESIESVQPLVVQASEPIEIVQPVVAQSPESVEVTQPTIESPEPPSPPQLSEIEDVEEELPIIPEVPKEEPSLPPPPSPVLPPEPEPLPPIPARDSQDSAIERADEKIRSVMAALERNKPRMGIGSLFKEDVLDEETSPEKSSSNAPGGLWPVTSRALKGIGKRSPEEVKAETGIDTAQITAKQTELSSPEITEMLHQLLNEWSIFRGSGFFGMGPSGPEHPLYKTLAPLSMGEVIAGRWEGSNHKLTKTIKQYIDAWRHEQGIAYVVNETFEHYLRRVIQRIVKRQQG